MKKYLDYAAIFLKQLIVKLSKYLDINKFVVNLKAVFFKSSAKVLSIIKKMQIIGQKKICDMSFESKQRSIYYIYDLFKA